MSSSEINPPCGYFLITREAICRTPSLRVLRWLRSAVVTSAAASALKAADEEKRRRDEADAIRRQSDADAVAKARGDRLDRLRHLAFPAADALVSAAPRRRARCGPCVV